MYTHTPQQQAIINQALAQAAAQKAALKAEQAAMRKSAVWLHGVNISRLGRICGPYHFRSAAPATA